MLSLIVGIIFIFGILPKIKEDEDYTRNWYATAMIGAFCTLYGIYQVVSYLL